MKNFPQRFNKHYLRFNPLFSLSNLLKLKIMDEVGKFSFWMEILPFLEANILAIHNLKYVTK